MPTVKLDIVLPCYNPIEGWATNILNSVTQIQELLPETELFIYLVNDGSTKVISAEKIQFLQEKLTNFTYLPYSENRGKGYALRFGVAETKNEYCIYTDIDFPYTEESLAAIYHALVQEKQDIAVGIRDENYYSNVPATRAKISKTLRFFTKKLLHLPVSDTQAGLKGFNSKGKKVFLQTHIDRYLFDLEFLFAAAKDAKLRIKPVKVALKPGIVFSKMNSKILVTEGYSFVKLFLSSPFSKLKN